MENIIFALLGALILASVAFMVMMKARAGENVKEEAQEILQCLRLGIVDLSYAINYLRRAISACDLVLEDIGTNEEELKELELTNKAQWKRLPS